MQSKLEFRLQSAQFLKNDATTDEVKLKDEKKINKEILAMNKRDEISYILRSGQQGATLPFVRFSQGTQGSDTPNDQYYHFQAARTRILTKCLQNFFDNIDGANIETSTKDARETTENIALDPDETIISLDVKSLCTNVPLKKAIEIA